MRRASERVADSAEKTVRDIRRATRRRHSAEDKIRIVLEGLRGEVSVAELCRKEGINQNLYYRWSKEFLEAGKKRLAWRLYSGNQARRAHGRVHRLRAHAHHCGWRGLPRRRLPHPGNPHFLRRGPVLFRRHLAIDRGERCRAFGCLQDVQHRIERRIIEPALRKSITFDNDTAFAQHALLKTRRAMTTWFCDAYASWQKGGVENANGRLRRWLPRQIDIDKVSDEEIQDIILTANLTPRKCLGFKTPFQAILKELGKDLQIRFS